MHKIVFHPDVEYEVKASYEWYENQSFGLGDDFLNELEAAYQTIIELPFRQSLSFPQLGQSFIKISGVSCSVNFHFQ